MRTTCLAVRSVAIVIALACSFGVLQSHAQVGNQPGSGFTTVLSSAMRYTMDYEQRLALLAADEHYVQELQRPPNQGSNLSRSNPGGSLRAGGPVSQQIINSDFLLVQLGVEAQGWMSHRDAYESKRCKVRQ